MIASAGTGALLPRDQVPLLAAHPGLHYLDSAATTQKPQAVLDAERGFYATANANPHRGAYALSAKATDLYHDARATVARFVGVADSDCVIFTRGTTEAMNLVASSWGRANVQAGDEIVITALEHHANFVPWQQLALATGATLRIVELTSQQTIDLDLLFFGQQVLAESRAGLDLVVPHPRLAERPFVLIPLCDLDPALLHPVLGKTVAQLLAAVSPQTSSSVAPGVRRYDPGGRPTRPDWQDPLFHQQN